MAEKKTREAAGRDAGSAAGSGGCEDRIKEEPGGLSFDQFYDFLNRTAAGIALMFGESCETVVQEVIPENSDGSGEHSSYVLTHEIYNGHVTGRSAGSHIGVFGVPVDVPEDAFSGTDAVNQLVILPDGRKLKSSSYFVPFGDRKFVLGINYDCTLADSVKSMLTAFTQYEGHLYDKLTSSKDDVAEKTFERCLKAVGAGSPEKLKKADRLRLIRMLDGKGFFRLQKSVPYAAEQLCVSKYTIYKDMKEALKKDQDELRV